MFIDYFDWEYDFYGEYCLWIAGFCLFLVFMFIVFWVIVIGGGIWLVIIFN